jgi:hypothetical protein
MGLRWRVLTPPLMLRWRGPNFTPAGLPQPPVQAPVATVIGPPGPQGPSGSGGSGGGAGEATITAVAASDLPAGMPVAISRANGKMIAADASYKPSAFVVGLLIAEVANGFVGEAAPDRVTLDDWTAATGAPALLQGQNYFLKSGGGLTTVPPGAGSCLVLVGIAISGTTLRIDVQPPIQL